MATSASSTEAVLADLQSEHDRRGVAIASVGISSLTYPARVRARGGEHHRVPARFRLGTNLAPERRGSHMSRLVEVVGAMAHDLAPETIPALILALTTRLDSEEAEVEIAFPLFAERLGPVSGTTGFLEYKGTLSGWHAGGRTRVGVGVRAPVQTLCPCSREISDYGAHNQRATVAIEVELADRTTLAHEDLLEIAESCASTPLYPAMKRADERHATMAAYDRPAFVEDVARDAALVLSDRPEVRRASIEVTSEESIHNHNAYARVEVQGRPDSLGARA
jgi:GTP cyclohydrolase I